MLDEVGDIFDLLVGDKAALNTGGLICAYGIKEHISVAYELFGARHIEYGSRIDGRRYGEREAAGDIGLDNTRYDIDGGTLSRYDKVHTRGSRLLSKAAYRVLDLVGGNHHKVGELVDENNYLMHRAQGLVALG